MTLKHFSFVAFLSQINNYEIPIVFQWNFECTAKPVGYGVRSLVVPYSRTAHLLQGWSTHFSTYYTLSEFF